MVAFLATFSRWALEIVEQGGYAGVFSLSLLDRLTVFLIPAEIVLPAFGILVSRGTFSLGWVLFWMSLGSFIGNLCLYFIFRKGGRIFLEKHGKYFLISKHELNHLDKWFMKYGDRLVILGYLIPTSIRSLVPIAAGITNMNVARFSFYSVVGFLPLSFIYVYAGVKAGDNLNVLLEYFKTFNYIIIALLAILVIWYIYRHRQGKHLTHE